MITEVVNRPTVTNEKDTFILMDFQSKEMGMIKHLMKELGAFIAGGYAVHCFNPNVEFGDVDLYFPSIENHDIAVEYAKVVIGYDPDINEPYMGDSVRATTFRSGGHVFQLIKTTYGTVQDVLDSFDFTNSKVAITYNPNQEQCLSFHHDEDLETILNRKVVKYRRQVNLSLDTDTLKRDHAKSNLERLEKYLQRFPNGFYDAESREQLLQQYAWNLKYKPTPNPQYLWQLSKVLKTGTQEELIMFYPLGGLWKKAFETEGASIGMEHPF